MGLGILAIVLFGVLGFTGVLLTFTYTPSPNDAYAKSKRSREIWIGALIRNMHHWSGNLL